jgi:hypothetical protein
VVFFFQVTLSNPHPRRPINAVGGVNKRVIMSNFTDKRFLDKNGFITPQPTTDGKPSDNGVLFESVAVLLGFKITKEEYLAKVRSCYLKPGLIARWPNNNFDQAAWDDYLGVATTSIFFKDTSIPREILSYGFRHLFIFNTDGKLESRDWLGRHVHVWVLMFAAAFPKTKFILRPLLKFMILFFNKPDMKDTSSIQLQWVYLVGLAHLGIYTDAYVNHIRDFAEARKIYYHKDHPFNAHYLFF